MLKGIRIIIIVVALAIVAGLVWYVASPSKPLEYKTREATVKSIRQMVALCSMDISEEVPVKDSINGKWIVARQRIEGHIRFNLDSLKMMQRGDTTVVILPPEEVEILESAEPGGYEVLDSWDSNRTFFGRTLTAKEENMLKTRWQAKIRNRIYDRGDVRRARLNAMATLAPLFSALKGEGPVVIIDPTPEGFYRSNGSIRNPSGSSDLYRSAINIQ